MNESIIQIFRIVFNGWKSEVRLVPKPNNQRVPGSYKHPLPDVKLSARNDHWVLNVFHGYPMPFSIAIINDLH